MSYPAPRSTLLGVKEKMVDLHLSRDYLYARPILIKHSTSSDSQNSTGTRYFYSYLTHEEASIQSVKQSTLSHTGSK